MAVKRGLKVSPFNMVRNLICQMRHFTYIDGGWNRVTGRNFISLLSEILNLESTSYSQSSTQLYLAATGVSEKLSSSLGKLGSSLDISEQ